jgi:hypothetical protein
MTKSSSFPVEPKPNRRSMPGHDASPSEERWEIYTTVLPTKKNLDSTLSPRRRAAVQKSKEKTRPI